MMAVQRPPPESSPPSESPNPYAPLALETDSDNDTNIPDPTATSVDIDGLDNMIGVTINNMISATTPGDDVNKRASSFYLL